MRKRSSMLLTGLVVLALIGGGCARDEGEEGAETPTVSPAEKATRVTFKASEYAYRAPAQFKGGVVTIELDNTGSKEPHEAEILRLDAGKTVEDYVKAASEGPPPAFASPAGGPGPVSAGKKATYTGAFAAGNYMLICHVPAPDGKEHWTKGMTAPVTISAGTAGALPKADSTITGRDFEFAGTENLKAGKQTVRASNEGQLPHNWVLFKAASGKTAEDFGKFLAVVFGPGGPAAAGPPPFTDVPGLIATLGPGADGTRTLELESGGRYVFVCFFPDTDGVRHFAKGMIKQVDIK